MHSHTQAHVSRIQSLTKLDFFKEEKGTMNATENEHQSCVCNLFTKSEIENQAQRNGKRKCKIK